MAKRQALPYRIRRQILERDDYACQKCGRHKGLEIHHIMPVMYGGSDIEGNLITLCKGCHSHAPDKPSELFKYIRTSLPPDIEESLIFSKFIINLLLFEEKWKEAYGNKNGKLLMELTDEFYKDWHKVRVTNELQEFSKCISKYSCGFKSMEEDEKAIKESNKETIYK